MMYPLNLENKSLLQMQGCTLNEFAAQLTPRRASGLGEDGRWAVEGAHAPRPDWARLLQIRREETRLDPDSQLFLATYPDVLHWVVLVAEDAPETMVLLPVLARLAAAAVNIDLRILCDGDGDFGLPAEVWEDVAPDLLDDPDLPLLLIFDDEWQLQEQWGPFPQAMEPLLDEWLTRHPDYEALAESLSESGVETGSETVEDEDEDEALGQDTVAQDTVAQRLDNVTATGEAEDGQPDGTKTRRAALESHQRYLELTERLAWEMRVWFNTELDKAVAGEICELLGSLIDETETDAEDEEGDDEPGG